MINKDTYTGYYFLPFIIIGLFYASGIYAAAGSDAQQGEKIYQDFCSVCHGEQGDGSSWAHTGLNPPPRNFTAVDIDRQRMIMAVSLGRPGTAMMPFSSRLDKQQVEAVVDYIRAQFMKSTANKSTKSQVKTIDMDQAFANGRRGHFAAGERFYQKHCFICHGRKGDGQGPRAGFMSPKPENFLVSHARATLNRPALFAAISKGKVGTVMPAWSTVLKDQEIADVAEYVFQAFIRKKTKTQKKLKNELGKLLYRRHCYFCHGYNGDANTLAAQFMQPPPVDFTDLTLKMMNRNRMIRSVSQGKSGTAMLPFAGRMSPEEIAAVIDYIRLTIMSGEHRPHYYHSSANGWGNHQQYKIAFPFATGQLPLDTPMEWLSPQQRLGKKLYMDACISCHDRGRIIDQGPFWSLQAVSYPRPGHVDKIQIDTVTSASPYAKHDISKPARQLSPLQKQGENLFEDNCAFCHAADGSGRNWIGSFLQPHPRDLTSTQVQVMGKQRLKMIILKGVPGTSMPAWQSVLSERQIDAVIAYIGKVINPGLRSSL